MVDTRLATNNKEIENLMNCERDFSLLSSINQDICGVELKIAHLKAQLTRLNREKTRVEKSISKYHKKYKSNPHTYRLERNAQK